MSKKNYLPFITNENLLKAVKEVLNKASEAKENAEANFNKNVVDPFSAFFDASSQKITLKSWLKKEKTRQIQKTLQNQIGTFHENILGSMPGCKNLETGEVIDCACHDKKIIAEIKNKYNTTKGNHKVKIYDNLKLQLRSKYQGYTGYYVEVIPKNKARYDKEFTPPDNETGKRRAKNKNIRVIDGYSFYALIAGHENALEMLYKALPKVAEDILKNDLSHIKKDSNFIDLFNKAY